MSPTEYVVRVTEDDITNGAEGQTGQCAISRAIRLSIPEARYPRVDHRTGTISFTDVERRERLTWKMTPAQKRWITRWDKGQNVRPIAVALVDNALLEAKPMTNKAPLGKDAVAARNGGKKVATGKAPKAPKAAGPTPPRNNRLIPLS